VKVFQTSWLSSGPSAHTNAAAAALPAGDFDGVSGTITWTFGKPAKYAFNIFFP
jgi:hypothetical protein